MREEAPNARPHHHPPARQEDGGPHRPPPKLRDLTLEAAELATVDAETSPVLCDTFLYEPEAGEEPLGTLALIAETLNLPSAPPLAPDDAGPAPESTRDVLDGVAAAIRQEYYRDPAHGMLESFEAALSAGNRYLASLVARGATDWFTNLHASAAVFRGTTLHVARTGSAALLLARHGHLTDIGEGLADPAVRNPKMAFANIASGAVSDQDALVLASPQLFHVVSRDHLSTLLTGKHPREAVTYLRDLLAETPAAAPFACLLLRFVRAPIALPAPETRAPVALAPHGGVTPPRRGAFPRLSREAQSAKWGPRLAPRPPLRLRRTALERALTVARRTVAVGWTLLCTRALPLARRLATATAGTARTAARTTLQARARLARTEPTPAPRSPEGGVGSPATATPAGLALKNPAAIVGRMKELPSRAQRVPVQLRGAFLAWPKSTKVFFVLTIAFAVLLAGSVLLLRRKRAEDAAIRTASERLQEARVRLESASAALIYDNADEARRLVREAEGSVRTVQETPYYQEDVAALLGTIQAVKDKSERTVRLPEPERVGDFASIAPDGRVQGLAILGVSLFSSHPETNAIFRLSLENGETSTVSQTSQGVGYFRRVTPLLTEQMLLFATDTPGLALFDAARGDLLKQEVKPLPEGTKEIRSLATYGSRLYLLLPEHRQILGYSKTLAGYQGGTPWLTDANVPVDRALDLGVDGYIYLLLSDGKIVKLLKGAPADFTQGNLATPLERPTRLVINETLKHLYVLDPPQKRVVVYDTTGALTRQFVFENATDLRDLAVGGKEEVLYVLDGTAVYKVTLK